MSEKIKGSTVVGGIGAVATGATAASAVVGGSAATIMSATAGTAGGAAIASGMATVGGGRLQELLFLPQLQLQQ